MRDPFQYALNRLYTRHGKEAVYNDGQEDVQVKVLFGISLSTWGATVQVNANDVAISVRVAEVPVCPRRGHTFEIEGTTYTVETPVRRDELEYVLMVVDYDHE